MHKKPADILVAIFAVLVLIGVGLYVRQVERKTLAPFSLAPTSMLMPTPTAVPLPTSHIIPQRTHVFQTFNNCGPASLTMQLSYFDQYVSQDELGRKLRPYQNQAGDNDDKSTTLEELAKEAETRGFRSYHSPAGSIEVLKRSIAKGYPVVLRTLLQSGEYIGHYRLIRGYDDETAEIIQDDSLEAANMRISYEKLLEMWEAFNYEYLIIIPTDKESDALSILGEDVNPTVAWQKAYDQATSRYQQNPSSTFDGFNASVAAYHIGDFRASVRYFEEVASRLPFRTLWYQIEPIQAYVALKDYERVFQMTDQILNNQNRAFSELYVIRGRIYEEQGRSADAESEFEKARFYNSNLVF